MKNRIRILTECFPDTLLIKLLLNTKKIEHEGGKPSVGRKLEKFLTQKGKGKIVTILDEDSNSQALTHPIFDKFSLLIDIKELKLKYFHFNNCFIIYFSPNLEIFLLNAAKIAKVNLEEFKLSSDSKTLHNEISLKRPPKNYNELIKKLLNINSKSLSSLKELIKGSSIAKK
ncbi:MAG: hypothetical protein HW421_548 [Ignavibacteria bacterium]|nr:hypothetical protein [Ignavibacteria bacterium]